MKHTKHIVSHIRLSLLFAVPFLFSVSVWATIKNNTPTTAANLKSTYYSGANNKSGSALFSALSTISTGVTYSYNKLTYDELWTAYITSDVYPTGHAHAGKIWDMYANCYYSASDHVSQMKAECNGGYNREHSLPKSWFGGSDNYSSTNQGCDLVHLVPTDAYVNNIRGNLAFGEVASANYTFEISKQGTSVTSLSVSESTISGTSVSASGTVFEPADEYKGDFARIYMYMRARYPSLNLAQADGGTKHFSTTTAAASDSKYGLTNYSIILLMKWHRQDPVSQKEIDRNNAIEKMQGNRNPFVDYPCLAEYLWGKNAGETFLLSNAVGSFEDSFVVGTSDGCACSTDPTLTVSPTSLTLDPVAVNGTSTKTFTVTGANLTGSISITRTSGSGFFTVSPSPISSGYNGSTTITVTYHPTSTGSHTATFTIASTGATSKTVTVSGTCTTVYTATWMANGSQYHQNTAASGSAPSVPEAPDDCSSSRVFMGWTETSGYTGSSAPANLFTDEAPTMTTDKTFYAVYADKTTSGGGSPVVSTAFTTTSLGSTNSVTTGYTVSATATAKTGYYQDGSGTSGVTIYNTTTPMFTSTPTAISLTVSIGAGSPNLDFSNYVYATLVNGSGTAVGTAVEITNHVTTSTGDSYTVSIPTTGVTSANGIYLYHTKESGKNIRYYSASLSITTGGGTTTYDNYSLSCSSGPTVTVTFNANGGSGTMAAQTVPQSTNTTLSTNTFTRDGYSFAGWATSSGGSVVYTDGGTINTSSDITLYAKWTALLTITMTFMNNGVQHTTRSGYVGQTVSSAVPEPSACTGYTFEGWSTNTYATDNTTSPVIDYTGTIPSANTTYYAVYSKTEGGGTPVATNNYAKITSTDDLANGNYLIVANNSGTYNAMNVTWKATYYLEGATVTPSADIITTTDASIIWTINVSSNKVSFLNSSSSDYLYIEKTTSGTKSYYNIKLGSNTTDNKFTYSVTSGEWLFTSATYTDRVLEYHVANTRWAYYTAADAPVYLYKQQFDDGSTTYHTTSPSCTPTTYTITVNANAGGTASGTGTYTSGSSQSISATPNSCYEFVEWNDHNTSNPRTITVTGDATYTASFQQINYTITATTDDDAKGTVSVTTP